MPPMAVVTVIIDILCGELVSAIKKVWARSKQFRPLLEQLESTVERITPIFKDIESLNEDVHRPATETAVLGDQLEKGKSLVLECAGARWWNKSSYAKKLIEYDTSLTRFFQIDVPARILHGVCRVEKNLGPAKPRAPEKPREKPKEPEKPKEGEPTYWGDRPWHLPGSIPARPPPPPSALAPPPPPPPMEPAMDIGEHPLDFLRNSPQFLALRPLLQRNPRLLKLTLQGLREKHPELLNDIKERKVEFLQLIYGPVDDDDISTLIEDHKDVYEELIDGPVDGSDGDLSDQSEQEMPPAVNVSRAEQEMPHTISVILAEQEAIERLEEMGFDSDLVIEAFLACDGNEELAVNYLLENAGYFED